MRAAPFIVAAVGLAIVTLIVFAVQDGDRRRELRREKSTRLCADLCTERGGMMYWTTKQEGFGSFNRYCVCKDTTETVLP